MNIEVPAENGFTVYSKSGCSNCDNYLNENKPFFLEFIKLITREECKQFPIIFRNAQYIGGYKECMNEVYRICFDIEDNF